MRSDSLSKYMNCENIELFFKPRYHLLTKRISSVEVSLLLANKEMPTFKEIEFLSSYEKAKIVGSFELWMLHETCKWQKNWIESHVNYVPLVINFTFDILNNPYLIYDIVLCLKEYKLPENAIRIAINTRGLLQNTMGLNKCLSYVKANQVPIILNGNSYDSSLPLLLDKMKCDGIKIDSVFLNKIQFSKEDRMVLEEIIHACRNMTIEFSCNGIDSLVELEKLEALGCDHGQGDFLSPLLSVAQMAKLLLNSL